MLEELLEDTATHNVRQTVFVECSSMYRADGPEELRVVGETEFVQGVAAKSASGHPTRPSRPGRKMASSPKIGRIQPKPAAWSKSSTPPESMSASPSV